MNAPAPAPLHLLSAGAAQGLAKALAPRLQADTGAPLQASFGAVGAMKEALLSGRRCDLFISTAAMIDALAAEGRLVAASRVSLGRVRTGVAVRSGMPHPDVSTPAALQAALQAADAIHFPDPERATAGIHFARVIRELGLEAATRPAWRTFPNGATAMRELAASGAVQPLGCTQVTEILYTPGVELAGLLPGPFELATVYAAAVTADAAEPALAARFAALLSGPDAAALRAAGGFEP